MTKTVPSMLALMLLVFCSDIQALLNSGHRRAFAQIQHHSVSSSQLLIVNDEASTDQKPLYDGTNYTFPDTTTAAGVAVVLEVSFVNACMQLRTGFVDVLKMFIAASMTSYELGFSIEDIAEELAVCPTQTANRPLMQEEIDLRYSWCCLVYLTLAWMDHPTRAGDIAESCVPSDFREKYSDVVERVAEAYKNEKTIPSVEELMGAEDSNLSEIERAIRTQSLRVVTLVPVVIIESMEARQSQAPPTPPIEGAFD
jgi:hypothetical protein